MTFLPFVFCNRDLKKSQLALWVSWPVLSLLGLSTSFSGLAIYSKYYGCDPVKAGRISVYDQVCNIFGTIIQYNRTRNSVRDFQNAFLEHTHTVPENKTSYRKP